MIMIRQVSVEKALVLISSGAFTSSTEVEFDGVEGIEALDAVKLGEAGVDVPEALIYYNDDDIVYDEEIDGLELIGELKRMSWKEKAAFFADETENGSVH